MKQEPRERLKQREAYLRASLSYDPMAGEIRWKVDSGQRARAGSIAGHTMAQGYRRVKFDNKLYLAHRLAWFLHHGEWPTRTLDHINEIKADNRLANLRLATRNQNGYNKGKPKTNTSGYKGVHWHKRDKHWRAQIAFDGKHVNLGGFATAEEAYVAYCTAAAKYHGEFANMGAVQ